MKIKQNDPSSQPRVGIFWYYRGKLLIYSQATDNVKESCGFVDVAVGHIDHWAVLQKQDPALREYEYEEVPRSRVLYDASKRLFKVYSSSKLIANQKFRKMVMEHFDLPASGTVFEGDEHYEMAGQH